MAEDDAAVAVDTVQVTEVGEKTDGAVAVESKQEFQPDVLAWLKKFKLESPDMMESLKKLNAYKTADLATVTEAQIAALGLKPAAQARFREGVSAVQAEQKPKTPTKEEREKQKAAAAAALEKKRAEERAAQIRAEKDKLERAEKEKKDKDAVAKAKAAADARAKEEAAEAERKRRFQETQSAFGPVKPQKGRGENSPRGGAGAAATTPPSTPPPAASGAADGLDPEANSPPIVVGAVDLSGDFSERETVAHESPEFSFHRDIISEDELREDLMRRKRFHDAQAAAMETRSSLAAGKGGAGAEGAGAGAGGAPGTPKDETPEERERRLRFQEAQKLAAAKVSGEEALRKSEEKAAAGAVGVVLSEDEEERKKRFEENKKKALEAKLSGTDKGKGGPIQLSEEEEERRRRFDENKRKAAEAAAEVERLKREDEEWQRTKGARKPGVAGSDTGDQAGKSGGYATDDEGTGGMCGCFGGKKKK